MDKILDRAVTVLNGTKEAWGCGWKDMTGRVLVSLSQLPFVSSFVTHLFPVHLRLSLGNPVNRVSGS